MREFMLGRKGVQPSHCECGGIEIRQFLPRELNCNSLILLILILWCRTAVATDKHPRARESPWSPANLLISRWLQRNFSPIFRLPYFG